MTIPLLAKLASQEFEDSVGPLVIPSVLRKVLQGHALVRQIADAFQTGTVTEQNLRDFIDTALGQLRRGEPLPCDLALASIAVAIERSPSSFATEFITGLAELGILEMQQSVLMAKECLKHRRPAPETMTKSFQVSPPAPPSEPVVVTVVDQGERHNPPRTFYALPVASDAHAAP